MLTSSGTETNFKVGGGAPIRSKAPEKNFLIVPSKFFGSKSKISRFGERFRDGQYTVWSVSCLLFFYSRCPMPSHLQKWGEHAPRAPWSRRHCNQSMSQALIVLEFQLSHTVAVWHRNSLTSCEQEWPPSDCGTLCTPPLIVVVGHYMYAQFGSGGWGVAWQQPVGGTTVMTDAATSSVKT